MKYVFATMFVLCALAVVAPMAEAGIATQIVKPFDLKISDITRVEKTNTTAFTFDVTDVQIPKDIAYWKVRTYCGSDMSISLASTTNACGKAVRFDNFASSTFAFLYANGTPGVAKQFYIKLKAYDKNGGWIHTEKELFRWK